jgi:hypothetical protein
MAKAQFHKNQKVWVETVGTWAFIEKVVPVWAKGFDEPVRITYEIGLGRDFLAHELEAEKRDLPEEELEAGAWRLMRAKNKWQQPEDCGHHPMPGTYPVVVTDKTDWGGWRVPGAEYDRDPYKIESQARLISASPNLMRLARELIAAARDGSGEAPPEMVRLAKTAEALLEHIESPDTPPAGVIDSDGPAQAAE